MSQPIISPQVEAETREHMRRSLFSVLKGADTSTLAPDVLYWYLEVLESL